MKKKRKVDGLTEWLWDATLKKFEGDPLKENLYFTTENGNDLCIACAKEAIKVDPHCSGSPIEYHINYGNEVLACHSCKELIKSRHKIVEEKMVAAGIIGTPSRLKEILTDMGFYSTRIPGVWKYSETLIPGNTIEACIFTHGNFWVNENNSKVYTNNYLNLLIDSFIAALLKIIDKNP